MSLADAASIKAAYAVKIYNHSYYEGCDRGYGFHVYGQLLLMGQKLLRCATDDAHFNEPDHFDGWVMVKTIENSQNAILTTRKEGSYFSPTGQNFHNVIWSDNQVDVFTSEISMIILQGKNTSTAVRHGKLMTYNILPFEKLMPSPWLG